MRKNIFRYIMPYCLQKQKDGEYVVLNRDYKPLCFFTNEAIDYSDYPISYKILRLTPKLAAKLSWNGSDDTECIYLYNDGTVPIDNDQNMTGYLNRLAIMAKLKIKVE